MLKDSQVSFDLPMTDTRFSRLFRFRFSRSLNQSYRQIPAKNFNKMVMFVTGIFESIFGNKKGNFNLFFHPLLNFVPEVRPS